MSGVKRTPQQNGAYGDGYRLEAADVAEERARVFKLDVLTICGLCDGFEHYGDPEQGRRLFLEHRNQTHAGAVDRGQKARRKAAGRSSRPGDAR